MGSGGQERFTREGGFRGLLSLPPRSYFRYWATRVGGSSSGRRRHLLDDLEANEFSEQEIRDSFLSLVVEHRCQSSDEGENLVVNERFRGVARDDPVLSALQDHALQEHHVLE